MRPYKFLHIQSKSSMITCRLATLSQLLYLFLSCTVVGFKLFISVLFASVMFYSAVVEPGYLSYVALIARSTLCCFCRLSVCYRPICLIIWVLLRTTLSKLVLYLELSWMHRLHILYSYFTWVLFVLSSYKTWAVTWLLKYFIGCMIVLFRKWCDKGLNSFVLPEGVSCHFTDSEERNRTRVHLRRYRGRKQILRVRMCNPHTHMKTF